MFWFSHILFLLLVSALIFLLLIAATAPVSLEEVSHMASVEKLKATKKEMVVSRDNPFLSESFEVWGLFFNCTYTYTYVHRAAGSLFETINITVPSKRGFLKATFREEELVNWKNGRVFHTAGNPHEVWLLKHILATVKNAVDTNRVDLSEYEALS